MKNKMKAWRKVAAKVNKARGTKHNGRRYKLVMTPVNAGKGVYPLLAQLMVRAGIVKPDTPAEHI